MAEKGIEMAASAKATEEKKIRQTEISWRYRNSRSRTAPYFINLRHPNFLLKKSIKR